MTTHRGQQVEVVTAGGGRETMRALTGPVMGRDFMVVWVCSEERWAAIASDSAAVVEEVGIPWPIEHVHDLARV